ncbi:hypothetical protein [Zhaonella formicivorans]|uniref:hypothetical protein n=1 Tax=Zhaonella formicivorans TaxID=2528593 RepID=UPI001D11D0E1|nr:hypothetical protein [Zhaonella formicivorans]
MKGVRGRKLGLSAPVKMLKRFASKGSTEIIAFMLVLPFLLLPILNTVKMLETLTKYEAIRQLGRMYVIRMETEGGLTPAALYELNLKLQEKGLEPEKVHLDYTPYPVPYGEEVKIKISYDYKATSYTIGLGGITKNEENYTMVYGPLSSVSKKYE